MEADLESSDGWNITIEQMDQVKELVSQHLESINFFDIVKQAVSRDVSLSDLNKEQMISIMKNPEVMRDIIQLLPL